MTRERSGPTATEVPMRRYIVRVDAEMIVVAVMATHGLDACREIAEARGFTGARHEGSIAQGWAISVGKHTISAWHEETDYAGVLLRDPAIEIRDEGAADP